MPARSYAASTNCPHCRTRCRTVRTEVLTPLVKEVVYACSNQACGHIFAAHICAHRTLYPSRTPDPTITLPGGQPHSR